MLDTLFPADDYKLTMRFRKGDINGFYSNTADHDRLTSERKKWIASEPDVYVALEKRGEAVLAKALPVAFPYFKLSNPPNIATCRALSQQVEPDFLFMTPNAETGVMELAGGSVCFASSWNFEEKMGKPIDFIHEPVPGLNQTLGHQINGFLARIPPGVSWERTNWGLSRSPELNQRPGRNLPRLDATVKTDEIFLRVEWQSLVALPPGDCLFGIRVLVFPFEQILEHPAARTGLIRALSTMPQPMAEYKNLATAREKVIRLLEGADS